MFGVQVIHTRQVSVVLQPYLQGCQCVVVHLVRAVPGQLYRQAAIENLTQYLGMSVDVGKKQGIFSSAQLGCLWCMQNDNYLRAHTRHAANLCSGQL